MIRIDLYYDELVNYADSPLKDVLQALERLGESKRKVGVMVSKHERKTLPEVRMKRIADEIRSIKPQSRGSIVTSGGFNLPFSGTKKLNLGNTPILIVSDESGPRYVFPCKSGETYYDVINGLKFLGENLPNFVDLPAETEESITALILKRPEILEEGLILESKEAETSTGKSDLLFQDSKGTMLLLEVEREATDQAVGQILRLSAGYEKQHNLKLGSIRAAIACMRINENVLAATKRAAIEVWKLSEESEDGTQIQKAEHISP